MIFGLYGSKQWQSYKILYYSKGIVYVNRPIKHISLHSQINIFPIFQKPEFIVVFKMNNKLHNTGTQEYKTPLNNRKWHLCLKAITLRKKLLAHHTSYLEHTTSYHTYKHNVTNRTRRTCANHSFVRKIMFQYLNFFLKLILETIFLAFNETLYTLKPIQSD